MGDLGESQPNMKTFEEDNKGRFEMTVLWFALQEIFLQLVICLI